MPSSSALKIGYVVKRYPRYSETFIVSEILAHEAAGTEVCIFALRPSFDTHFQDMLSRVRAPVRYLGFENIRTVEFWQFVSAAAKEFPDLARVLLPGCGESPVEACQGIALAREAIASGLDHLHAHFGTSATAVARIASRLSRIPFTFTAHAKDIYHHSVGADGFDRKLRDAAACITVSDFNLEFLLRRFPGARGTAVRVYNGVDVMDFPYEAPAHRDHAIVAVGRLVEKKGCADLVEACGILRDAGQPFTCRIVGGGPLEEALRGQIHDRGLGEHVILTGVRPRSAVIREVQSAAVLAAPCLVADDGDRDGLPTVIIEAMALGTPCVATPVTGIPEAILDERTGLLVPERDPPALAAALIRLLSDPLLRVSLAEEARRRVEREFDVHQNAAKLRDVFVGARQPQEFGSL